ncbi:hypothetical protein [Kosmotoga pacifica]|uniref:Uncharacterized protein n=1 Tax=Kosmotoga pacifica TaxID=1330330 RepID=A0A0G2Z5Z0_9BACT|nr:hypothetical protein [Kosmotoga pacifica]AKI97025.1 hypothetical protein IX53_03400 [Kosmotoga pacifica]
MKNDLFERLLELIMSDEFDPEELNTESFVTLLKENFSTEEAEEILESFDSLFGGLSDLIENPREYFFGDEGKALPKEEDTEK